jgi:hypothetical protein
MFTAYLRERFPQRIFAPAAIGIVVAAHWASTATTTAPTLMFVTACSFLLLLQFRLWDDLEDRDRDAATHPERLLVRMPAAPYRCTLMGLALANVALCGIGGWPAAVEMVLLNLAFHVAYRRTRRHVSDGVWRFSILLLKYPAFVVVLATMFGAPQPGRVAAAALVAYSTACGYEALHGNRRLATYHRGRGGRGGRSVLRGRTVISRTGS